ncbi:MAG: molybdopterin biosynthesis protein [Thermodesulfobacteriota bacterium]|nr:molybdopterin biosynthesis protein [Thermodesulfobacteriota bacterium]
MTDYSTDIYLKKKSLTQAREILFNTFARSASTGVETMAVTEAVGRILAEGVSALVSSPANHVAAMDGIAVKAENTFGAAETAPKTLRISTEAFFLNTGNLLPSETNAVIMIEDVHVIDDHTVEIMAPAFPWQYVRKVGEDIVATELLFPANHLITPYCVGALLSAGIMTVSVTRRPCVLIIPTGDELVACKSLFAPSDLPPGKILETNAHMLGALVAACGAEFIRHDIVEDDPEKIKQAVQKAVDSGMYQGIFLLGGSSAGARDYSKTVISELGDLLIHGVTIMPGKPFIAGSIKDIPVFGIPGYPVSAVVCFEEMIRPFLYRLQGLPAPQKETVTAVMAKKVASKLGVEEFLRVKLGAVGDRIVATPLPRGAGSVTSLADADAFVRIPADTEGMPEATPVAAERLNRRTDLDNTLVVVGSHDNTLDVIADMFGHERRGMRMASSHVGSMGGLMALKKGFCHVAGTHLFDPETRTYNITYIKKHLPGMRLKLVRLVSRRQGLIVPRGNPKNISGLEDLAKPDIRFINRQPGSGTRILLDYRLDELRINGPAIAGYDNEEYTHMAVAVAVASGAADAGLGIYAAARALGLDFVPVVTEQYELAIPEQFMGLPVVQALMTIITRPEFATRVEELGGYSTEETGRLIDIS